MFDHPPSEPPARGRVTVRSVLLGLILIPVCQYWIFQVELVRYTFPTLVSPFYNAIFILAVLALWNGLLQGLARLGRGEGLRRLALTPVEMLVIYAMVSVASALSSSDMLGILVSEMGHADRFATPENRWQTLFASRLPDWLVVRDPEALKGYYEGHSSLWTAAHLRAWLRPTFWWSVFATALAMALLLVCVLLRKQWIERERLTYPIIFLPLEMTQVPSFYRNGLLWAGIAVAGGITLLNGFHELFPAVPGLPIKRVNIGQNLVNAPWNGISFLQRMFYLFGIGIAFLMPLDLSISCWFFYLLYLAERILCRAWGLDQGEFPYYRDQAWGAYLGLFLLVLWASRDYWRQVLWTALRGSRGPCFAGPSGRIRRAPPLPGSRAGPADMRRRDAGLRTENRHGLGLGAAVLFLVSGRGGDDRPAAGGGRHAGPRHAGRQRPYGADHHARNGRFLHPGPDRPVPAALDEPGLSQPPHPPPVGGPQAGRTDGDFQPGILRGGGVGDPADRPRGVFDLSARVLSARGRNEQGGTVGPGLWTGIL
jgi:hypothetical protein